MLLHPRRSSDGYAGNNIEAAADAHDEGDSDLVDVLVDPVLFLGRRESDEHHVGSRGGHIGYDLGLVRLGEVAVAIPYNLDARVPVLENRFDLGNHLFLRPEKVDAVALLGRQPDKPLEQVDARDAFPERNPQLFRRPDDRGAVGVDQGAFVDNGRELGIGLHQVDLGGVDDDMLRRHTLRYDLLDFIDRLV